jgi:hypothetical protein
MANPNMTRFKAMSMDEQVETIIQSTQEALRAREEIRAAETTKVQGRGLVLTPEAHTRGLCLMAEEHRVIDQLQNDPDLIEMRRVPVDNPIERWGGPSNPELIQIEETTRSYNPEVSMPKVGSPGDVSA